MQSHDIYVTSLKALYGRASPIDCGKSRGLIWPQWGLLEFHGTGFHLLDNGSQFIENNQGCSKNLQSTVIFFHRHVKLSSSLVMI
jgi:hypothetical protein